jgi:alpha,alpha-trehalase
MNKDEIGRLDVDGLLGVIEPYYARLRPRCFKHPMGELKREYLVPGGPYYEMWDWDHYFIGLHMVPHVRTPYLENSILNFLDYTKDDGHTPHFITPQGPSDWPHQCKPFLARGAKAASMGPGSVKWVEPIWDKLVSTVRYWEEKRKSKAGLFIWYGGIETGSDNNPAVYGRPDLSTVGVDLAVFMAEEYRTLAWLARELGRVEESGQFERRAAQIVDLIVAKMWHARDRIFYNIDEPTGKHINIMTWTNLLPIRVLGPGDEKAQSVIANHLLSPDEFLCEFGLRSLSKTEQAYNQENIIKPVSNWQGPMWPIANWLLVEALVDHGFASEALDIALRVARTVTWDLLESGATHECYNAETGEPLAAPGFVGWNLLVWDMLHLVRAATQDRPDAWTGRRKGLSRVYGQAGWPARSP